MHGFRFAQVHKSFGALEVLRGIDLAVDEGECVVIIGGSGSGKSVMLKLLTGLLKPDRGRIFVWDAEVSAMDEEEMLPVRRRVGMLFQGGALFDSLSVYDNVAFPLREHGGHSEADIKAIVEQKLSDVGLPGIGDRAPSELSGGMRKRVALARTIALDPDIILYDEPTTGLDPANAKRISRLIRGLHEKLGCTTCIVTHDMECARIVGGRFAFLAGGKILVEGPLDTIDAHDTRELRVFLGEDAGGPE
jgi:phospholipid/cholesterol/gamma-HCH transport system ATP-binding protein